ncbi:MAG: 3'-5' exonuclease, partial [Methanobacteriota archaeon]
MTSQSMKPQSTDVSGNENSSVSSKDISSESGNTLLGINQVEYSNGPDGPIIHIFGRKKDGSPHEVLITGFQPYFYIKADQATRTLPMQVIKVDKTPYKSIHREEVRRLYTNRPTDVRDVRNEYTHFEADIPFATRFMIDRGITSGIRIPTDTYQVPYEQVIPKEVKAPTRYCIIDIECQDDKGGLPNPDRDAIICITAWDSFDNAYKTFILQNQGKTITPSGIRVSEPLESGCFNQTCHEITIYDTERELLTGFVGYINDKNPDLLTGWNFIDFDLPFIFGRIKNLNLPPDSLARLKGMSERSTIRGRVEFDLLAAYKKMQSSKLESYRLDAVGEREVGDVKAFHYSPGMTSAFWKDSPSQLIEYNFKDVELCV